MAVSRFPSPSMVTPRVISGFFGNQELDGFQGNPRLSYRYSSILMASSRDIWILSRRSACSSVSSVVISGFPLKVSIVLGDK
ncbi:unnamed protein product, partial [Nesidiocoris tenuis]